MLLVVGADVVGCGCVAVFAVVVVIVIVVVLVAAIVATVASYCCSLLKGQRKHVVESIVRSPGAVMPDPEKYH
eukprot:5084881-Amphidinium_carterae.1